MSYTKDIANQINELLEKNYDAEAGYKQATEKVKSTVLQEFFKSQAQQRYNFGHELKSEIKSFGQEPDKGTSIAGDLHRTWIDIKSKLSSDNKEAVLEEAIRGEKAAVENYNQIINSSEIPASTKQVLTKHRDNIQSALNRVESLENIW